jgi:hypothetical protein
VFRVKQLRFRVNASALEVAEIVNAADAAAPVFQPLLTRVDDLQVQLELAKFQMTGTSTGVASCFLNSTAPLAGTAFGALGTCPAAAKLNKDAADADVYRVVGVRFALTVRGGLDVRPANTVTAGMFDRAGAVANDKKRHLSSVIYLGLPNAYTL